MFDESESWWYDSGTVAEWYATNKRIRHLRMERSKLRDNEARTPAEERDLKKIEWDINRNHIDFNILYLDRILDPSYRMDAEERNKIYQRAKENQ